MKTLTILFATAAVASLSAFAVADTPWQTIKTAPGGFSFEMPAKPKLVQRSDTTPVNAYVLVTGDGVMMAGYSEPLPFNVDASGAKKVLDDFEKGMMGSAKLTSAGRREVQISGRAGCLLLFQGPKGEFWRVAAAINGDRIVFQMFIGEKGKLASPSVARFFNSLKFS